MHKKEQMQKIYTKCFEENPNRLVINKTENPSKNAQFCPSTLNFEEVALSI